MYCLEQFVNFILSQSVFITIKQYGTVFGSKTFTLPPSKPRPVSRWLGEEILASRCIGQYPLSHHPWCMCLCNTRTIAALTEPCSTKLEHPHHDIVADLLVRYTAFTVVSALREGLTSTASLLPRDLTLLFYRYLNQNKSRNGSERRSRKSQRFNWTTRPLQHRLPARTFCWDSIK